MFSEKDDLRQLTRLLSARPSGQIGGDGKMGRNSQIRIAAENRVESPIVHATDIELEKPPEILE